MNPPQKNPLRAYRMSQGQWGQAARITSSNGPNSRLGLVRLEAHEEEHPLLYTIDLWAQTTRLGVSALLPKAFIEWGNNAAPLIAEVDFVKGTRIRVAGNYVRVSAFTDLADPGGFANVSASASVYSGSAGGGIIAPTDTFVRPVTALLPAFDLSVPSFAKDFLIYRADDAKGFTVTLQSPFATAICTYTFAGGAPMTVPIRLPGNIDQIEVVDTTGTGNTFTVSFGIDL